MKVLLSILTTGILAISTSMAKAAMTYRAQCSPNRQGTAIDGYKCTDIGPGTNYEKAGLQNSDIVKSIDQIKIDSAKKVVTLFQRIDRGTFKEIVVSRAGKEITLNPTAKR